MCISCFDHKSSKVSIASALYFSSTDDLETVGWRLDFHDINEPPKEGTWVSPRGKIVYVLGNSCSVTKTATNFKVIISWRFAIENVIR